MMKKIFSTLFLVSFLLSANVICANAASGKENHIASLKSTVGSDIKITLPSDSQLIKTTGSSLYYVQNNQLIKIEKDNQHEQISTNLLSSNSLAKSKTLNENFNFYQRNLSSDEISLIKSNLSLASSTLTRSDENMDSMGSVRAQLSVEYSQRSGSNAWEIFHLYSASGSATQLHSEGVVPTSSDLYWSGQGDVYQNGSLVRHGTIGFTRTGLSPWFSNYQLMPSGQELGASTLGVTYTVHCKRGVSVDVPITFA
jgi:hypothetical protein